MFVLSRKEGRKTLYRAFNGAVDNAAFATRYATQPAAQRVATAVNNRLARGSTGIEWAVVEAPF